MILCTEQSYFLPLKIIMFNRLSKRLNFRDKFATESTSKARFPLPEVVPSGTCLINQQLSRGWKRKRTEERVCVVITSRFFGRKMQFLRDIIRGKCFVGTLTNGGFSFCNAGLYWRWCIWTERGREGSFASHLDGKQYFEMQRLHFIDYYYF